MAPIIFDIETGPEEESVLRAMEPEFKAPGNYKDPAKIAEKIAEQRDSWLEKAALCATTGRVLAIGLIDGQADETMLLVVGEDKTEADLIREFWSIAAPKGKWRHLVGFNSNRFDIPFLVRRSMKLGVRVPWGVMNGRFMNSKFIDLMEYWKLGDFQASISLDRLAKHLGCGAKNGSGAMFAELLEINREEALAYLENDIRMTRAVAERLGVLEADTKEDY